MSGSHAPGPSSELLPTRPRGIVLAIAPAGVPGWFGEKITHKFTDIVLTMGLSPASDQLPPLLDLHKIDAIPGIPEESEERLACPHDVRPLCRDMHEPL